jgi:hypothetical protein
MRTTLCTTDVAVRARANVRVTLPGGWIASIQSSSRPTTVDRSALTKSRPTGRVRVQEEV